MFWFWTINIPVVLLASYFLWPREQRVLTTVLITASLFSTIIGISIYITQWWPVERKVIQKIEKKYVDPPKVVYRDKTVYRQPGGEVAPVDVEAVCKGRHPVQITIILQQNNDDKPTTWVTGHLVGSSVLFTCGVPGAFQDNGFWKVGDIVQFVSGQAQ